MRPAPWLLLVAVAGANALSAQAPSLALLRWQRQNTDAVRSYDEARAQSAAWFDGMHLSITRNEKAVSVTPELVDGPAELLRPEFWRERERARMELLVRNDSSATTTAESRRRGDPAEAAGALERRADWIAGVLPALDTAEARERRASAASSGAGLAQMASLQRSNMQFYARFARMLRDEHARLGRQVRAARRAAEPDE